MQHVKKINELRNKILKNYVFFQFSHSLIYLLHLFLIYTTQQFVVVVVVVVVLTLMSYVIGGELLKGCAVTGALKCRRQRRAR